MKYQDLLDKQFQSLQQSTFLSTPVETHCIFLTLISSFFFGTYVVWWDFYRK